MVERAFGGSSARKLRAVLPEGFLKGEKVVVTLVMYLVSMLTPAGSCVGEEVVVVPESNAINRQMAALVASSCLFGTQQCGGQSG